jgi:hypothetical protein
VSDLVIRSGGVVEVDTASLREVGQTMTTLAREVGELGERAAAAVDVASQASPTSFNAVLEAGLLRSALERASNEAEDIASRVTRAAALYEAVELHLERDAAVAAGDQARIDAVAVRLGRLTAADPNAVVAGRRALDEARADRDDLYTQAYVASLMAGPLSSWLGLPVLFGVADLLARGPVASDARLTGNPPPVSVRATAASATTPPASLAEAASRIPAGDARIRVEKYAMADGTRQYAVYVAGTNAGEDTEPFDMASNLQLYSGQRSASYGAVEAALREAGARPGDTVHAFGHSQGAMVLERLALEGDYDTRTLVSFGSPVHADVGADTLSVSVRHTDDPVAALQSGGHPGVVGATGSFVVERVADPLPGLHDLQLPAHQMSEYRETAGLIDVSDDPRVDSLREVFAGLQRADAAEGADYLATRLSRASGEAGG